MKFEISERIVTDIDKEKLIVGLEEQFRKVAQKVVRTGDIIVAKSIEASFGSINRNDTTTVYLKGKEDGYFVVGEVHYSPSVAFWIILLISLFTYVFWLLPILFYLGQKKTVRNSIQEVFNRVRNEFMTSKKSGPETHAKSNLDQLDQLAGLKDRGFVTEEEFQIKKRELLNLT